MYCIAPIGGIIIQSFYIWHWFDFEILFQITDTILSPEVAFTGDTTTDFMLDPRNADALRAKILITEVQTVDSGSACLQF